MGSPAARHQQDPERLEAVPANFLCAEQLERDPKLRERIDAKKSPDQRLVPQDRDGRTVPLIFNST